jgi:hypothetical protein
VLLEFLGTHNKEQHQQIIQNLKRKKNNNKSLVLTAKAFYRRIHRHPSMKPSNGPTYFATQSNCAIHIFAGAQISSKLFSSLSHQSASTTAFIAIHYLSHPPAQHPQNYSPPPSKLCCLLVARVSLF